jgi:hypothetical protein
MIFAIVAIGTLLLHLYLKRNSMIKVSLDEAYVFDLLSIYAVKIDNSEGDKKRQSEKNYNLLSNEIIESIGIDKFTDIILSDEYKNLVDANQIVFDLVDRAKENKLAKATADANYERYLKKVELQQKFFETKITEIKI